MRPTTKKLTGAARDRFLARLPAEPGLAAAVTSLRVRRADYARIGGMTGRSMAPAPGATVVTSPPAPPPSPLPAPAAEAAPFDPYRIGLVPVYQREGRDGLLRQLAAIPRVDHLRQLARAQNIALAAELRTGDIDAAILRQAIVDAVARRIADRRGE